MKHFIREYRWVFLIILILLLIPWGLNFFLRYGNLETGEDLRNVEWLAFWGSYLGGAATLIAVFLTLSQNNKVIKQNEKILSQNQKNLKFREERARIALMPYMEVTVFVDEELGLRKKKLQPPYGFIVLSKDMDSKVFISGLPKKYLQIIVSGMIGETDGNDVIKFRTSNKNFVRLKLTQKRSHLRETLNYLF